MKILTKYKLFLIKEQISNMPSSYEHNPSLEFLKNSLLQLKQSEDLFEDMDEEEIKEILDNFEEAFQTYPKALRDFQLLTLKLIADKEYRDIYKAILTNSIEAFESGKTTDDIQKEAWYIELEGKLYYMTKKIGGLTKEETDEVFGKFIVGSKKYVELKKDSVVVSEQDPYGEEEWDGMSEEERIRKAFEEE